MTDFTMIEFYLEEERDKHKILKEVQINTLFGCESVKDYYYIRLYNDGHCAVYNDKKKMYMKPHISSKDKVYWRYGLQIKDGGCKHIRLHRLVGLAFISGHDKESANVINHIDLERPPEISQLDNCLLNIEWCSQAYNAQSENRRVNPNYKKDEQSDYSNISVSQNLSIGKGKNGLNYEKIEKIFDLLEQGNTFSKIGKIMSITGEGVSLISKGKRWKDHPRSIEYNKNKVEKG